MTATQQRERAIRLAESDPAQALKTARSIGDPWFACQALAWVARFAPNDQFSRIVGESLRTARDGTDSYRVTAASAWPVRAIVERQPQLLSSVLPDLLGIAQTIEPAASRSEALFLLFQAVFPAGRNVWLPVFQSLISASVPITHWRQRRNLHDAMLMVWNEDKQTATDLLSGVDDPKLAKQFAKSVTAEKRGSPRPFFWSRAA
jgi:hypothetical protein